MSSAGRVLLSKVGHTAIVLALSAAGTILLIRVAPGYFDNAREMDALHGQVARAEFAAEQRSQSSVYSMATRTLSQWTRGDLGQSRQYGVSVSGLIRDRAGATLKLLARGIAFGWLLAFCSALPLSMIRGRAILWGAPFTFLLAVPTGAMATLCLLSNKGGPVLVLTLLLAARNFKFLESEFRQAWKAPHLLQARAQGLRTHQIVRSFVMPNVLSKVVALATLSIITALSAIVPIEVIFDVPGLGQLAWTGAMNRDLPILLGVTLLMAVAVSVAGFVSQPIRAMETA